MRGLRKPGSGDALDVEGFVSDETVSVHQLPGLLVVEVPALVGDPLVQLRYTVASLAASGTSLLLPGKRTLRPLELLLGLPVVARWLYRRAIRGDEEALEPEIYADRRSVSGGFGSVPEVAGEDDVPLAARRLLDGDGLDRSFDGPVQLDLDVPDALDVEPGGALPVVLEAAPVAVGRELDGPESAFGFEARVPGTLLRLDPAEECLKSDVNPISRTAPIVNF